MCKTNYIDAEFETVHTSSDRVLCEKNSKLGPARAILRGDALSPPLFYGLMALLVVVVFMISGGHALFDADAPDVDKIITHSTGMVDTNLRVEGIHWHIATRGSTPVLFVKGQVRNPKSEALMPKTLTVLAHYKNGSREKLYIKGHKTPLAPSTSYQFHGQMWLKHPDVMSVAVGFKD